MTDQLPLPARPAAAHRPGPLGRLAAVAFRRRGRFVLAWVVAIAAAAGLSVAFAGDFSADYSAPGSDSSHAQELLSDRFPSVAGETVDVVVRAEDVTASDVQTDVADLLEEMRTAPHVVSVDDPYSEPGNISPDGRTLVAQLTLTYPEGASVPVEESELLLSAAEAAERPGLEVALGGQSIVLAEQGEIGSEGIALVAAAIILLFTFGSVVAAGLPILVAIAGLSVSAMLTGIVAAAIDVPDWSTALATMLGIALGIDYTLLMVTRFREWRATGLDAERATVATLDTAGRSVLVAGVTVVVSMLGLFAMGLSFMRGAAAVAIIAVLIVMAAATTLFPAVLGYLGDRVDRLRLPLGRRRQLKVTEGGHVQPARGWLWWGRLVNRHGILATVLGVGILLAIAAPFLGARFGFPDAGNEVESKSVRQAYDMLAEGFGAGGNGPLLLAADMSGSTGDDALDRLVGTIDGTPGVATVTPPVVNEQGDTAVFTVVPTTGPQDSGTEQLVHTLRDDVIPTATNDTSLDVYVGGVTATAIDSSDNIVDRLPLLIGGVVLLSMVLLMVAFRSVVIPATAAMMNLLSVAAAYGVVALALEGGWFGQLIGVDTATPMPAFIPVLIFAVLFGLSMDYEVFLISRMRESWVRTGRNGSAVVDGLAGTGRVITAAAAIMVAVFAAFIPSDEVFLKVIGVGMAAAIFIDATVVRMLLVPAVMHIFGRTNWWLPAAWDRLVPQLRIEGRPEAHLPAEQEREPQLSDAR